MSGQMVAVDAVLALIEAYGEINMEACGDFILTDPCLSGKGFSPENVAISDRCTIMSTIHSSKYHACQELMEQIREMAAKAGTQP